VRRIREVPAVVLRERDAEPVEAYCAIRRRLDGRARHSMKWEIRK